MTITTEDQFTDTLSTLETLMREAEEVVTALNSNTSPGELVFLVREGLTPEAITALSGNIEDTYEKIFEYALAQSRTEGSDANFWENRATELDAGYKSICEARERLRDAEKKAMRTDCDGRYIILGEGPIHDDEEFTRQTYIIKDLLKLAESAVIDPVARLELGSLGLLDTATRIEAVKENLHAYVTQNALNDDHPHQVESLVLDATIRRHSPKLTGVVDILTDLSIVVYHHVEFQE
jgi:hypothetical protein